MKGARMFATTFDIERDAIRRLADAVHRQGGFDTVDVVKTPGDPPDNEFKVALRSVIPPRTFIFKGTIRECYCYLNGWLHATKEVR